MTLLAIDTATEILELVLVVEARGARVVETWREKTALNHSASLMPALEQLLRRTGTDPSRLDALACNTGPGSFTGLRIGMAAAKGLSEGWQKPLLALCGLEAMLWESRRHPCLTIAAVDARKKKFYCLCGRNGLPESAVLDIEPDELASRLDRKSEILFGGHQGALLLSRISDPGPSWRAEVLSEGWSGGLAEMAVRAWNAGRFLAPESGPEYLRPSEAEENRLARQTAGPQEKK